MPKKLSQPQNLGPEFAEEVQRAIEFGEMPGDTIPSKPLEASAPLETADLTGRAEIDDALTADAEAAMRRDLERNSTAGRTAHGQIAAANAGLGGGDVYPIGGHDDARTWGGDKFNLNLG